jgi:hypothetical protein
MFVLDNGIKVRHTEYIKGIKAATCDPLTELIQHYQDMIWVASCMAAIAP